MLHRASSASNFNRGRKPCLTEGSILEDRDGRTRGINAHFRIGKLLGEGGFAKCFEVKNLETGEILALKVCERQKLIQTKTLGKLQTEIAIHRRMNHKNIVKFHRTFQDDFNVYILLEICRGTTLMDISRTRSRFTVAETQHIMLQSLKACQYMNQCNVIHRDLKLGNMMMDHDMNVKIGDFGLAAELAFDGERKRTICGTPNYIAPEVLQGARSGHSFEVDVWSLGVIMYTLLVGHPPFQQRDVKQTYEQIKKNRYSFPAGVDVPESAKQLIYRILQSDPNNRPTLMEIRNHAFFNDAPSVAPMSLYPSRLRAEKEARMHQERNQQQNTNEVKPDPLKQQQVPPVVSSKPPITSSREPLRPVTNNGGVQPPVTASAQQQNAEKPPVVTSRRNSLQDFPLTGRVENIPAVTTSRPASSNPVTSSRPTSAAPIPASSSCAAPAVWVTDYADFSNRYGLAYRLSSGHTGCHYNDNTKLVWEPISNRAEYYSRVKETIGGQQVVSDQRQPFVMDQSPEELNKKTTLIKYFKSYIRAGGKKDSAEVVKCSPVSAPATANNNRALSEPNMTSDMIYIKRWMTTDRAMIFRLSNRVIQVCFFDKTEVILASESRIVTFSDANGNRRTIPATSINQEGGLDFIEKFRAAQEMARTLA